MSSPALKLERSHQPVRVADQTYRAREVAALLGIGRSTFYTLHWFKGRKVRMSDGTVGYLASDVALYQSLRRGL